MRETGGTIMEGSIPTATWNNALSDFFDVNDVGMDSMSSWNNEEIDVVGCFDLYGWSRIEKLFYAPALKIREAVLTPIVLRESFDFFRSAFWSWGGSFRYDEPI